MRLDRTPKSVSCAALLLACAAPLLAGCSSSQHSPGAASRAGTLVIGATREPRSLNPLLEEGEISEQLGQLLYTFLVTVDNHGNQVPEAAREVPTRRNGGIAADGLRIVYHLRRDIRWQDGARLTARDCVFTFAAIANPRNNLPSRAGYDQIRSVTAPDDATVVVRLKQPYASDYGCLPRARLQLSDSTRASPRALFRSQRRSVQRTAAGLGAVPGYGVAARRSPHARSQRTLLSRASEIGANRRALRTLVRNDREST